MAQTALRPAHLTVNGVDLSSTAFTVSIDRPVEIVYSYTPVADPNWQTTDTSGHEHYCDNGYPTLEWAVTETWYCGDCRNEHKSGEYRCRHCGEVVMPGTTDPEPTPVSSPTTATLELDGMYTEPVEGTFRDRPVTWIPVAVDNRRTTFLAS